MMGTLTIPKNKILFLKIFNQEHSWKMKSMFITERSQNNINLYTERF